MKQSTLIILLTLISTHCFSDLSFTHQASSAVSKPLSTQANTATEAKKTADNWQVNLGAGAIYSPEFLGSKDYELSAIPDFSLKYKNLFFLSFQDGLGYNFINQKNWQAGPLVRYAFARKEDASNPFRIIGNKTNALQGLGNVNGTVELGGFAKYRFEKYWSSKAELLQGVNSHNGLIASWDLNYSNTFEYFGPPIIYSFGPDLTWANGQYNNTYWGIDQTQSINSGLAEYQLKNGLVSYGAHVFALMPLNKDLASSVFLSYERLSKDLANSPLISERGSRNQLTIGLGLNYSLSQIN